MNGYLTVSFFCFGVLIVLTYAWQRFNEPSFPHEETLPRTVEPLRYLFLKPAYAKARLLYLVGLLVLYALLVLPGPSMVGALGGPPLLPASMNFTPASSNARHQQGSRVWFLLPSKLRTV